MNNLTGVGVRAATTAAVETLLLRRFSMLSVNEAIHRPLSGSIVVDHRFPFDAFDRSRPVRRGVARPLDASGGTPPECDTGSLELIYGEIFWGGSELGDTSCWPMTGP
jgi:hypothetical protein